MDKESVAPYASIARPLLYVPVWVWVWVYPLTDTFIQKTKKLYLDTRTQRNLTKLNEELNEVHSIMTKNIEDFLRQGEKLESE